jgi:hypothetical protein
MKQQVTNFARFYRAFSRMEHTSDEMKCELVLKFTGGRTNSLKEIQSNEYDDLCRCIELSVGLNDGSVSYETLRRHRSEVLHLMQKLGVDTSDWSRVDDFCLHPKIAGQPFRQLSAMDLESLSVKLRAILRNGGLKPKTIDAIPEQRREEVKHQTKNKTMVMVPLYGPTDQMIN